MKRALLILSLLVAPLGCADKSANNATPPIAEAWQARCGNCHVRVEPHSRTRVELHAAFERHQSRTRLTREEWKQLEDFLATDAAAQDGTASMARR